MGRARVHLLKKITTKGQWIRPEGDWWGLAPPRPPQQITKSHHANYFKCIFGMLTTTGLIEQKKRKPWSPCSGDNLTMPWCPYAHLTKPNWKSLPSQRWCFHHEKRLPPQFLSINLVFWYYRLGMSNNSWFSYRMFATRVVHKTQKSAK